VAVTRSPVARTATASLACTVVAAFVFLSAPAPVRAEAPSTFELSSFVAEVSGSVIVGGTRTVTVTNPNDDAVEASVALGEAPCDCVEDRVTASAGIVAGGRWDVGSLAPGESATLILTYAIGSKTSSAMVLPLHAEPGGTNPAWWPTVSVLIAAIATAAPMAYARSVGGAFRPGRHRHRDAVAA
jgi:hypothetical protein